jgi:hypothetical protein
MKVRVPLRVGKRAPHFPSLKFEVKTRQPSLFVRLRQAEKAGRLSRQRPSVKIRDHGRDIVALMWHCESFGKSDFP